MAASLDSSKLLAEGLHKAIFFKLNCKNCGILWRFALAPDERPVCPKCADREYRGRPIAHGYTRRELPLAERWRLAHEDETANREVIFRDTIHGGVYFSKLPLIRLWE